MNKSNKMSVLTEFGPYHRLTTAFNSENFRQNNRDERLKSIGYAFIAIYMLTFLPLWFVLVAWFCFENGFDWNKCVVGVPILVTFLQLETTFIGLLVHNHTITETIAHLKREVEHRCADSKRSQKVYADAESTHAKITIFLFKASVAFIAGLYAIPLFFPISYAIFDTPQPEIWRMPIETHSLLGRTGYIGFLVDWLVGTLSNIVCFIVIVLSGSMSIGMCIYINAMVKDIEIMLIEDDTRSNSNERKEPWSMYVREIQFHNEIISLSESLFKVMELVLFIMTLTMTILIAFNLFAMELNDGFNFEIFIAFYNLIIMLMLTVAYYYVSEWITTDLLAIGDIFYNSPWYNLLTPKQQKLLTLTIQRAQREVRLTGLGLFDCSLPTFSRIIRSAVSYFLMIRQM